MERQTLYRHVTRLGVYSLSLPATKERVRRNDASLDLLFRSQRDDGHFARGSQEGSRVSNQLAFAGMAENLA